MVDGGPGEDLSLVPTGSRHNDNGSTILPFLNEVTNASIQRSGLHHKHSGPFIVMIFRHYPLIFFFSFKPFLCALLLYKDAKVPLRAADDAVILKTEAETL